MGCIRNGGIRRKDGIRMERRKGWDVSGKGEGKGWGRKGQEKGREEKGERKGM